MAFERWFGGGSPHNQNTYESLSGYSLAIIPVQDILRASTDMELWTLIATILGLIVMPIGLYLLQQNREAKRRHQSAQKDTGDKIDDLKTKYTELNTIVSVKKETVDKVHQDQISHGVRLALVESAVQQIKDSQTRAEQNQERIMERLGSLPRIEEKITTMQETQRNFVPRVEIEQFHKNLNTVVEGMTSDIRELRDKN